MAACGGWTFPTVPATIITFPEGPEVVIDNNITLTCSASGIHLPTITWSRGGENIREEKITQNAVNETFLISEVKLFNTEQTDTGNYSCSANNSAGVDTQTFYLQVLGI